MPPANQLIQTPTAELGLSTPYSQMSVSFVRRLIIAGTGIDPSGSPQMDLNALYNLYGVQPVVMANDSKSPLYVTLVPLSGIAGLDSIASPNTVSNSLPQPLGVASNNQTIKNITVASSTADTAIYTAPAGKTLYVFGFALSNASGGNSVCNVESPETIVFSTGTAANNAFFLVQSATPVFTVAPGTTLDVDVNSWILTFWGYEM